MSGPHAIVAGLVAMSLGIGASASAQESDAGNQRTAPVLSAEEIAALEPAVNVAAPAEAPAPGPAPAAPVAQRAPAAMDSLDLGTTSITGNQELPKVLYIVPWKRSDLGDLVGRPANTLLEEVLAPVDPEVFERQLGYYDTLNEQHREE